MSEIITFATDRTTNTDNAITIAGFNCTVIANAEHIPNTCTVIGLLSSSGSLNNCFVLLDNNLDLLMRLIYYY